MSGDPRPDDDLLAAARAGDDGALTALFDRHRGRLETLVRLRMDRRLQGRLDPADVIRDASLAVQAGFPRYAADPQLPLFLWLRLEVLNKLTDAHCRHLGTHMRIAGQEVALHRGALPPVTSASLAELLLGKLTVASHAATRAELKLRVQEALNGMDAPDREVLVLRHFEELTNAEAAQVLGIRPSAACNRYVHALKRLRDVFQAMGDVGGTS